MGGAVVSRLVVLGCGTLYPAYASYKAVKSANVRQYVRWMMYWIIFALFITVETFTDILLSWAPFYYEIKVGFVIWLLSPYTKGAAFLYRKFVHPFLSKKEPEIDRFLMSAKERSYATMVDYGSRGINVATSAFVTAAVRGQAAMSERLKSFSVNDISRLSDDTPVHSMNPMSYNPQLQREVLRRSPDTRAFDGPTSRRPLQPERQSSEQEDVDVDSYEMINPEASQGGLAMHRIPPSSDSYSPATQFPSTAAGGDNGQQFIGGQYKAYSMMNLSHAAEPEDTKPTIMTRTIQFTTAPPETSVDDSMIPDQTEHFARGDPSYSTLPRQRKKKSKKDKEALVMTSSSSSSSLRRSKRHTRPPSYLEGSDDEHERY